MALNRAELKKKTAAAASAEEITEIFKDAGIDLTEEKAADLFEKAKAHKSDKELSADELETVSGGADRDWLTDGCAATVEPGSWCGSEDSCSIWDVTYDNEPSKLLCPKCGVNLCLEYVDYDTNPNDDTYHYRCPNCGTRKVV